MFGKFQANFKKKSPTAEQLFLQGSCLQPFQLHVEPTLQLLFNPICCGTRSKHWPIQEPHQEEQTIIVWLKNKKQNKTKRWKISENLCQQIQKQQITERSHKIPVQGGKPAALQLTPQLLHTLYQLTLTNFTLYRDQVSDNWLTSKPWAKQMH